MPQDDLDAAASLQSLRNLLRKIDRAMLASGASERHHQILKSAALVIVHAGVHQRHDAGQILMDAFLLVEVVDHRRVPARQRLEALFAAGIRQAAPVKDKAAAVPALIFRQAAMKRETENPHHQIVRIRSQSCSFSEASML